MTNAIILAAGMGTRLRPLTKHTHKSLLPINHQPLLERSIEFLLEQNVKKIIIVTGYLSESFEYLIDKYNEVEIIYNEFYQTRNNLYSLYLVRQFLSDSYILEGDLYFNKSVIKKGVNYESKYFVKKLNTNKEEWIVSFDENYRILDIQVDKVRETDYISAGVSYLNAMDGIKLQTILDGFNIDANPDIYWDDVLKENLLNIDIFAEIIEDNTLYEIDDVQDYEDLKQAFNKEVIA